MPLQPAIKFERVHKSFIDANGAETVAAYNISLEVQRGETLCFIGPSGSGKTTLMKMVNRLIAPQKGQICVGGEDVATVDIIRLRRSVGYVTQHGGLFPHLNVAGNIGLLCALEGWTSKRRRARVSHLLDLVGLCANEFSNRYPRQLSGGERQRVSIARSLALDPPFVLMDEPFSALDPLTRGKMHEEFQQLSEKVKKTIILVTHDMEEAFKIGDRVALLNQGRLHQVGSLEDFRSRPASDFVVSFLEGYLNGC